MKATREPGSRCITITDLPETAPDGIKIRTHDLEISIRYTDSGPYVPGEKAVALDGVIIPAIIEALNKANP